MANIFSSNIDDFIEYEQLLVQRDISEGISGQTALQTFAGFQYESLTDQNSDSALMAKKAENGAESKSDPGPQFMNITNIGYYDLSVGQGNPNQAAIITNSGHNAVNIFDLSPAELASIDVLYVQNPDNFGYSAEWLTNLPNVEAAVQNGLTLIFFDRYVANAEMAIPGAATFDIVRDFTDSSDIEADETDPLVIASTGAINDTDLDGGNSSSHGYIDLTTSVGTINPILTTSDPNHGVLIEYELGTGRVFYSTIPADFYISSAGAVADAVKALIGNMIEYIVSAPVIIGPTQNNDDLNGTANDDTIDMLEGDDIYSGLDGNDTIFGNDGNDTLNGDGGNDQLYGGTGADLLYGGDGDDFLIGGTGADTLNGGAGRDYAIYSTALAGISLSLQSGGTAGEAAGDSFSDVEGVMGSDFADVIGGDVNNNFILAGGGNDRVFGGAGDDLLFGGDGNDQLTGGTGADTLLGGDGIDTVHYITSTERVVLNLATGGTEGDAAGDSFGSIEIVFASDFNDVIYGTIGSEALYGMEGNDNLSGGAGDDLLYGGNGNDTLMGGEGADHLSGGRGIDTVTYSTSREGVTVNLKTNVNLGGDAQDDTLLSVENLFGSRFADNITGDLRDNLINGLNGNDIVYGQAGNDRLFAGAGSDVLNGGDGNDTLSGQSGFNQLNGDAGNDLILGGTGQDFINGGTGIDTLSGGAGTDQFIFEADHGFDRITDFVDGEDKIKLIGTGQSFADLLFAQDGNNVQITSSLGTFVVNNVDVTDFDAADFIFA